MADNEQFDIIEFATQTSKFIENNFKIVLGVVVGIIVAGVAWAQLESMSRAAEEDAFAKLYAVTKTYNEKKENFDKAKNLKEVKDKSKVDEEAKNLKAASGDLEKDYGEEVAKLEKFLKDNLGSNASGEAALILSEIYDDYKMPEKGVTALELALKDMKPGNILYYVMKMRSGDLWAASNNCDKAIPFWQVVANSESFIAGQAQLKLGVCFQQVGRMSEAKNWFEKIQAKDPNSAEGFNAKRYLRFIQFKSHTGEGGSSSSQGKNQGTSEKTDSAS